MTDRNARIEELKKARQTNHAQIDALYDTINALKAEQKQIGRELADLIKETA